MSFFIDNAYEKPSSIQEFAEEVPEGGSVKVRNYLEGQDVYVRAETVDTDSHPNISYEEKVEVSNRKDPAYLAASNHGKKSKADDKRRSWEDFLEDQGLWTRSETEL
ncbi:MAG: hypothetical protein BRC26_00905 [Nanohaloarchaea archaeon QH_8_44_6]|nr:MAG: hypothetical protein BRC26_00905 [Nanohaloarchaea archaeon QH_8_44_6]